MKWFSLMLMGLLAPLAWGVDTLTVTDTGGQIATVTYEWTSDGSGDATGRTSAVLPGVLFTGMTLPGTGGDQPTDNYDVVVYQAFTALGGGTSVVSTDLAAGGLANRDDTAVEVVDFWPDDVVQVAGMVQIVVSNAGATKQGKVVLAVARHLAIQTTELSLVGGSSGQFLQYSAPGLPKYVSASGHLTLADGGAFTIPSTFISDLSDTTPVTGDYLVFWDATDSTFKKGNASNFLGAGLVAGDITGQTLVTVAADDNLLIVDDTDGALKKIVASDLLAGSGDVTKVGTPVDGQIGVWTGDGTIEGDSALTFDTTDDTLVIAASGKLGFGAVDVITDSAGTTTLNAVDALDATTESTIEAAIDTLANLTSIQGQSVTVSGTTTISGTNTGDQTITLQGDVTGTGTGTFTTTIAAGAVDVAMHSATGTPSSSTYYRGDNTWSAAPVVSVNSQTGTVVLDADDIDDTSTTNKFVTAGDLTNLGNLSGTNSGDVTLSGTPDYITIAGQVITRGSVDLAADITGITPIANGGTGASTLAGASIPTYTSTNTFTNKRITRRSGSTTSSATPTINTDSYDLYRLTAQAADITSFTTNLSGTPVHGDLLEIEVTGTAARAITWGASFAAGAVALPTTTVTTETLDVLLKWSGTDSKWVCMASDSY